MGRKSGAGELLRHSLAGASSGGQKLGPGEEHSVVAQ